jgi:hypothetical protein
LHQPSNHFAVGLWFSHLEQHGDVRRFEDTERDHGHNTDNSCNGLINEYRQAA